MLGSLWGQAGSLLVSLWGHAGVKLAIPLAHQDHQPRTSSLCAMAGGVRRLGRLASGRMNVNEEEDERVGAGPVPASNLGELFSPHRCVQKLLLSAEHPGIGPERCQASTKHMIRVRGCPERRMQFPVCVVGWGLGGNVGFVVVVLLLCCSAAPGLPLIRPSKGFALYGLPATTWPRPGRALGSHVFGKDLDSA